MDRDTKVFIDYKTDESKIIIFDKTNAEIYKEERIKMESLNNFKDIFSRADEVIINIDDNFKKDINKIKEITNEYNQNIRFVSFRKTEKMLISDYLYLKKYQNIAYFLVDDKLKGALMIDRKIIKGYNMLAGSFDLLKMKNKEYIEKLRNGYSIFYQSILENEKELTFDIIVEAKLKGDQLANIIYEKIIKLIVKAIINVILIVDPEVIILNPKTKKHQKYIIESVNKEFSLNMKDLKLKTKIIESPTRNKSILVI